MSNSYKVYEKGSYCSGCPYFTEFAKPEVVDYDNWRVFRIGENRDKDESTLIGKCLRCNYEISKKYLQEKIYCPFYEKNDVHLVRIWCKAWRDS